MSWAFFATNFPLKKSKNKSLGGVVGKALASQFKLDFTLISCMVSSMMGSVWYLDNGASFHMIGDMDLFRDLEDKELQMHIEMGCDRRLILDWENLLFRGRRVLLSP